MRLNIVMNNGIDSEILPLGGAITDNTCFFITTLSFLITYEL